MKSVKFALKIFFVLALILSVQLVNVTNIAHAQAPHSIDGVDISHSPTSPAPGEQVTIKIESYNTDLTGASIVWMKNQKTFSKGIGQKQITIAAPALGQAVTVSALIVTVEGRSVTKTVTIKSGDIDLVVEPQSYIPSFYKGKAPFIYQGNIKIIAVPHFIDKNGASVDPSKLVYKWKRDYKVLGDQSGYGKQTLIYKGGDIPRTVTINVEVASPGDALTGEQSMVLEATNPSILLYEEDPLYGIMYNSAIGNRFPITHSEVRIRAIPFGFNADNTGSDAPTYTWSVNSQEKPELGNNESVLLRVKEGAQGSSAISLDVKSPVDILDGARADFQAFFNNQQSAATSQTTF